MASTKENPYDIDANGYCLKGGGMVGDRLVLSRFDFGLGGGQEILIDILDGLGTLPQKGSIRITYDPYINEWSLFMKIDTGFIDPMHVDTLLGTSIDSIYTNIETKYFSRRKNYRTEYF